MRTRAAALLLLVACSSAPESAPESRLPVWRIRLTAGSVTRDLRVDVATTSEERRVGLMNRASVPEGTGMLFVYPGDGSWGGIWMKDTLVPLDVAFLSDGVVLEVHTLQPCRADPCLSTEPAEAYDHVLEVPAGWFARAGLGRGTTLRVIARSQTDPS